MGDETLWHVAAAFDDAMYRAANPDVAAGVARGDTDSTLRHYLLHGYLEGRAGVPAGAAEAIASWVADAERGPLPSARLRSRVHGDEVMDSFVWLGRAITIDLLVALHRTSLFDAATGPVLDFGVGCGRVARFFAALRSGPLSGCDIDPETVAWCAEHLATDGTFSVNGHWPPSPYEDASMRLVFAISVFTHLPADMEAAWITDISRVLEPGGVALLTTHGMQLLDGVRSDASPSSGTGLAGPTDEPGFVFSEAGGAEGLPDFYRTSFHTEANVRTAWAPWLEIVEFIPRGVNGHQDLIVARKRP
jgi:SAM-dependent methyltransferase